jgi:hypothetical protein
MWASAIVEIQVAPDRGSRLADTVVGPQVDLLVFDAAPQPLDEDVVSPRTFAVHADRDAVLDQQAGERGARELRALAVLKISGLPCFTSASSNVSTQNVASMVIDTRHDRTRRLNQSSTTAR